MIAAVMALVPVAARAAVSVTISVRQTTVAVNDAFALTVTVEGALNVPAPDLDAVEEHFSVRSAGSSTNMSMVNGRITQSKSFTYMLLPRGVGAFTVGPARVDVDGTEYLSNTFEITVVEGGAPAAQASPDVRESSQTSSGREVFATTSVDKRSAYVDEQITLSFKYYRRSEPMRQPQYEPPDLTGFWVEDLDAREEYIEIIEGMRYRVTELKTALFGASSGTATVSPATLLYYGEGQAFTFFSRPGERQTLRTDPIEIEISPLPAEGRPAGFTGAVGRFQLSSSIDVSSVAAQDPVTFTVTVRGEGNIRTVPAPDLASFTDFRVYESGSSTEVTRKNGVVGGVKRYEFVLIPETEGEKIVPAIELQYFDPSTRRYERTGSTARSIEVMPGSGDSEADPVTRAGIERVGSDIRYIRESTDPLAPVERPLHARPWFMALQLVPVAALVLVTAYRRRSDRLGSDERLARHREASARARDALKVAAAAFAGGNREDGCSAVARAITGFIGDRTGMPARGMKLDELASTLSKAGADEKLVARVRSLLGVCDAARFAGADAGVDMERLPDEARECIREVERLTRTGPWLAHARLHAGGRGGPGTGVAMIAAIAVAATLLSGSTSLARTSDGNDAGGITARFREANALYAAERYDEAAGVYETIIDGGFGTADVHYNLGNARFKLGEPGRAVLAYERALRVEPGHTDARANLAFVREQLADRQAPLDDGPVTAFLRRLYTAVHVSTFDAVASLLFFGLFAVLIVGVLRGGVSGWSLRAAVTLLAAFVVVATAAGVRTYSANTVDDAVVLASELAARTGPGGDFVLEFKIHEGTTVAVEEVRGEWTRVRVGGTDLVGWVMNEGLEAI